MIVLNAYEKAALAFCLDCLQTGFAGAAELPIAPPLWELYELAGHPNRTTYDRHVRAVDPDDRLMKKIRDGAVGKALAIAENTSGRRFDPDAEDAKRKAWGRR